LAAARSASTTPAKNGRVAQRLSFAKISDTLEVPDLLALQTESFEWLVGSPAWKKRIAEAIGIVTADQNAPFNKPDEDPLGTQDMSGMIKTVAYAGVAIAGLWALSQYLGSRKTRALLPSGDN
jgi:hypothetical protein